MLFEQADGLGGLVAQGGVGCAGAEGPVAPLEAGRGAGGGEEFGELREVGPVGGDGLVGIGRIAAANAFEVNGNASKSTAGDWLSNSDARIKTAVADLDSPLERLLRLRPVTFRYTEAYLAERPAIEDVEYYNVIAQEYAEVFPDAVKPSGEYLPGQPQTPDNAVLQVDFHPASVLTVAAVQELAARLAELEAENLALRERLARIEARLGE